MSKRKLVVSTGNLHKVDEIRKILADLDLEVLSKNEIGLQNFDVVEDGVTLEENSVKKAKALAEKTNFMVIADDSGLFVDSLNGEPGVYSSRYAGEDGNDKKNNIKLLENLKDKSDRSAAFKTVIALVTEDKTLHTVEGICQGSIVEGPKGDNGFGYDPLFIPNGYDRTFGELGDEVKNKISHRARALDNLKDILKSIMGE